MLACTWIAARASFAPPRGDSFAQAPSGRVYIGLLDNACVVRFAASYCPTIANQLRSARMSAAGFFARRGPAQTSVKGCIIRAEQSHAYKKTRAVADDGAGVSAAPSGPWLSSVRILTHAAKAQLRLTFKHTLVGADRHVWVSRMGMAFPQPHLSLLAACALSAHGKDDRHWLPMLKKLLRQTAATN